MASLHKRRKSLGHIAEAISNRIHGAKVVAYWLEKQKIQEQHLEFMDWRNAKTTMVKSKLPMGWFITKHLCGMCGVGKFLLRWKEATSDSCLRCGQQEDARHVWTCAAVSTAETWQLGIQRLKVKVQRWKTDPQLTEAILWGLTCLRHPIGEELSQKPELQMEVTACLIFQDEIGWESFLEGFIHSGWSHGQQTFYKENNSHRTGKKWERDLQQSRREPT
jgi:hypothetical protein